MTPEKIKKDIFRKVREYYIAAGKEKFIPGKSQVNYAGRVFDDRELVSLVDSALDFWLTSGRFTDEFEKKLSGFVGKKYASFVNSGSSANFLAITALTSHKLGKRRLMPGDEVITVAAGFPTTVAPIIQNGLIPVFIDVQLGTYNIDCTQLEKALSKKTKAVFVAHTLGNPCNISAIQAFCKKHKLWFMEDNCDSLGSKYKGRYTGSFGDISTFSFYPAHHITTGEGGAVLTDDPLLKRIIDSFRDWGRDCWCRSGKDNTCGKRFKLKMGELPFGYDHKYIYSHFGYNLKATEMQAAIGCAQIDKLPDFIRKRQENYSRIFKHLKKYEDKLILPVIEKFSKPSPFGFLITVRDNAGFTRDELVNYLETNKIQTRMLFAGNIIKHPCFDEMRKKKKGYRVVGNLQNTDSILNNTFWLGVYPGLSGEKMKYMIEILNLDKFSNT